MRRGGLLPVLALALSCNGTTGYDLVSFYAAASGAPDAVKGQPYTFDAGDAHVTLTRAKLHVGALYLTQSVPQSGGGPAPCTLPGTQQGAFVGEVRGGGDVDLLDPSAQSLSVTGDGSTVPAATGQVWLMHGDVNAGSDPLAILTVQGTFESAGQAHTFSGAITIDGSRQPSTTNTALPGAHPICQLRIVSGIPVDVTLAQSGTLVLRIDPRQLFNAVTLSELPDCPGGIPADRCFTNDETNQPSTSLFKNLTGTGPYGFEWLSSAP
jgi:hypothetical protein